MIINPERFQAIVLKRGNKNNNTNNTFNPEKYKLELEGIQIDNKFSLILRNMYLFSVKKASLQLFSVLGNK